MAVRVSTLSPRRILATGFGAFVVLYVLTAAWVVVRSDTQGVAADAAAPIRLSAASSPTEPGVSAAVTPAIVDFQPGPDRITIIGTVGSPAAAAAVVRTVVDHTSVTLVVNRLAVDPGVGPAPAAEDLRARLRELGAR